MGVRRHVAARMPAYFWATLGGGRLRGIAPYAPESDPVEQALRQKAATRNMISPLSMKGSFVHVYE